MLKPYNDKTFIHERIIPFRGNWNLLWVIQRYLRSSKSGIRWGKLINAACALVEMKSGRIRVRSKPFVLRIEPTNACNLRCPRCSCGIKTDPRRKGYMAMNDYRLILKENQRNGIIVRLDGNGEPTLHTKIFKMIEMAKLFGYAVSMSTNFNTDLCADVEKFIDSGLDRLVVAIDGSTQSSYEKYRVGGNLALVEKRLVSLLNIRKKRGSKKPFIEVQFLDWGYNRTEISDVRRKVQIWGVDKFEVIYPDYAATNAQADLNRPRRCFWLWCVLTVDWELNYRSCTNAWTLSWPRLNLKNISSHKFWNSDCIVEARQYNIDKSSDIVTSDTQCHCNNCSDMLVVNRPAGYVCE